MNMALAQSHVDVTENSGGQADIAAAMGKWFRDTAPGRAASIAMTEVGTASERSKAEEAAAIGRAIAGKQHIAIITHRKDRVIFPPGMSNYVKVWQANLDEKTRQAHVEADWQTVNADEPFVVMGENLMFPGDESMGASLENIINCRCSALYYLAGEGWDGSEPDL
jgi:uncharacterized protein with gpF-like domain